MPKNETFESDQDGTPIAAGELVVVTVHRVGQGEDPKAIYLNEDQLADLLEESETLGALVLSD